MSDTAAVWELIEQAHGDIAATVRAMLKQPPHDPSNFGTESQQRRIGVMQTMASDCRTEEQRHSAWMAHHESQGWVWGEQYSESGKTHPNLVAWEQLPVTEQAKARIFHRFAQLGAALCEIMSRDTVFQWRPNTKSDLALTTASAMAVLGAESLLGDESLLGAESLLGPMFTAVPALDSSLR